MEQVQGAEAAAAIRDSFAEVCPDFAEIVEAIVTV
jgi:hypothetical protein